MSPRQNQTGPAPSPVRSVEAVLAFLFGCIAIGVVLWLAFRGRDLSDQQFEILRIVLALAGGGVGAVIPGLLNVTVKESPRLLVRAGGALAVFVIVYFSSPSHWKKSPQQVYQHTEGIASPVQNGNSNSVTINGGSLR